MTDRLVDEAKLLLRNVSFQIVSQGAEALVFKTNIHPYFNDDQDESSYIIKYRPRKPYRHPKIDKSITKSRTIGEVKFMFKLAKAGIRAPRVVSTDYFNGIIWMEHIGYSLPDGKESTLKNWLWYLEKVRGESLSEEVQRICVEVGYLIGDLHLNDMIHGDLTSSNIMLDKKGPALIDFGLSSYSALPEDKAVDLYVLERAMNSTHADYASEYNSWLLKGYEKAHSDGHYSKQANKSFVEIIKRLEDVRLRGRKRSMIG
ncbi:Piso0_000078 [Millerozyma farinosa CBS 7064]|uniref:EKC/KEOPS complex subunit BUD32 n=1 Tax=Pichia sorbitophila (strain ATCC MYA-4447 / BCRC 22081 / CBS 7064 / NBRC 10061 / NRRL Y-12695) TaxID=559304 RepID=G8YT14_PICSO|nr:Piso0_000078 [Millerozyma farinosa CBS 7064]